MKKRKLVYISGPIYSSGVASKNMNKAIHVANELMEAGFCVYIPHLSVIWDAITPQPRSFWMKLDLWMIERSQIILRLDGYSEGAEEDIKHANSLKDDIKIYYDKKVLIKKENPIMDKGGNYEF